MAQSLLYIAPSLATADLPTMVRMQSAVVEHIITDRFTIADARQLQYRAQLRPVGDTLDFVVNFHSITPEAQNALLKTLEEPPKDVSFHIVVHSAETLLPTVRSRLLLVSQTGRQPIESAGFLSLPIQQQLDEIANRTKQKDSAWIESIVCEVEQAVHRRTLQATAEVVQNLALVRRYLDGSGASRKMLLESLILACAAHR